MKTAKIIHNQLWTGIGIKVSIEIISIDKTKLYPVRYKYLEKGYDNLVFSATLSEIIFK